MAECLEIVRFRAKPGDEQGLLDDRPQMVQDIRDRYPGLVRAELTKLEDGVYLDVLRWRTKEEAETANANHEQIPGFVTWVAHVGEVLSFETAIVLTD